MSNNDAEKNMAVKAALLGTMNTPGWRLIKLTASKMVQRAVEEALEGETPEKRETAILKASALKKGFADLFNAAENTIAYEPPADDNGFGELEYADIKNEENE
jgi:hypothetical protein